MNRVLITLLILLQLLPAADRKELRIERWGQAWIVSYDASKIPWSEAFEIAKLSPEMNHAFYTVSNVQTCIADLKEYAPCGTRDLRDPNFFKNAQVNIRKQDDEISALAQKRFPGPLATVRDFILKRQKFWRWSNATVVAYLRNREIGVLEGGWPEDPGRCDSRAIVERIRRATSEEERFDLVNVDWANCQNSGHLNLVVADAYPKDAWEKGVAETGVTVEEQFRRID